MSTEAFKAFILRNKGLIPQSKSLGEHLRNRRLALALRQEDVAKKLRPLREVSERWERDVRQPVISEWPSIVAFLGYYPARDECVVDVVLKARQCQGVDQKGLAAIMGVVHQRLRRWEHGTETPTADERRRLATLARPYPSHRRGSA